jgi:CRP-like cAMP-binding protein
MYAFLLRGMQQAIFIILSQSIETKLALLLLYLLNETAALDGETISLKLAQEDIAGMLGVTHQSLSKPLSQWKKKG